MRIYKADLHIHSCLSPCADLDMSPKRIVEKSRAEGLDIIALCDHNSAENVEAAIRAGKACGVHVLPGMEINSREEVHVLAIFDRPDQALAMQTVVYKGLTGMNRPEFFGDQVVVNAIDEVEGFNDRLLIGSVKLGLEEIVRKIHALDGLCVASHVDRPSYSIISQLGFVPPEVELDALEISDPAWVGAGGKDILANVRLPFLTSSDAHFLSDVGRRFSRLTMACVATGEIRLALQGKSGRAVEI
jgi:PHP family Zn ribbon phosphoesterase